MFFVAEVLLANPGRAFAAHLGKAHGAAVHPNTHEMATNACHGTRAFRHLGTGVVRAARTEPGHAICRRVKHQTILSALFGINDAQLCIHARQHVGWQIELEQTFGQSLGNEGGREIGIGSEQTVSHWIGHGPLAAGIVAFKLIKLAHNARPLRVRPVVQLFFQLILNDLAFFLHHQNLFQAFCKLARSLSL